MQVWTPQDATAVMPRVRENLGRLRSWNTEAKALLTLMRDPGLVVRSETLRDQIRDRVATLEEQGTKVRHIAGGIIDLMGLRGQTTVCLCHQEGEDAVACRHGMDEGSTGRRPLPTLPSVEA